MCAKVKAKNEWVINLDWNRYLEQLEIPYGLFGFGKALKYSKSVLKCLRDGIAYFRMFRTDKYQC